MATGSCIVLLPAVKTPKRGPRAAPHTDGLTKFPEDLKVVRYQVNSIAKKKVVMGGGLSLVGTMSESALRY